MRLPLLAAMVTSGLSAPVALAGLQAPPDTAALGKRRATLEEITVTATRTDQVVRVVPANVAILTKEATRLSAAQNVPDLLRVLPGFSTRDFQSLIVAHPSRSAAAFRGLGTTSSSRALVLLDGIPINEPFAGWVHWPRVPLSLVERIEAVRGGGSGVWGSRSLGGVINLVTIDPPKSQLELSAEGGMFGTARGSASGSYRGGKLRALGAGDFYDTNGFVIVRSDLAGPIDTDAFQTSKTGFGRLIYDPTSNLQFTVGGSYLDQSINTGTPMKATNVAVGELRAGVRWLDAAGGVLSLTGYRSRTNMDIFSTSESADRTTETPSLNQFDIPSTAIGAGVQWSRLATRRHHLTMGIDWSRVDGSVHEDQNFQQNAFTRRRRVAGEQLDIGVYLQDQIELGSRWRLLASGRLDRFKNQDATRRETDLRNGNVTLDTTFAGADESRFSYSVGVNHQASAAVSLRASGYGAFRAPTLNELYKPAREGGNVLIEADATLRSERLIGAEVGADLNLGRDVVARLTAFVSRVEDPIIDATVGVAGQTARVIPPCGNVPAGGTCRQRRNTGALRTTGLESEVEVYPSRHLSLWLSYTFNPTKLSAPPEQVGLDGKSSRSAPRHAASMIVSYRNPAVVDFSATGRYVGARFEDDLNTIELDDFFVLDLRVERSLFQRASAYFKVENVFNREYEVNRTAGGFARRGIPRFGLAGMRIRW
jgi:outer membrane receptor protein involved in Fe transport